MRPIRPIVVISLFLVSAARVFADTSEVAALEKVFHAAVERVKPSLVGIKVTWKGNAARVDLGPGGSFQRGAGPVCGLIVDADGSIVTSDFNVDEGAEKLVVMLADGRELEAKLSGRDMGRGLRLLKVDAKDLPVPVFLPKDQIRVGQWALAVGVGKGPGDPQLAAGIVSADDRLQGRAIQIDATTNPANYGGPVLDLEGRVMGIITPLTQAGVRGGILMSDTGIGFAAHASDLLRNLEAMKRGETIRPAFLGIQFDASQMKGGARVSQVLEGTGAEKAGIKPGDVIVEFGGETIDHSFKLLHVIGKHQVGDEVTFKVKRGDEIVELKATLSGRPENR